MRDLLLSSVILASLPAILVRPWIGVLMWAWLGYMNPHRMCFGFAADFPFSAIVVVVTLVGLLCSRGLKAIPLTRETVFLLSFCAWMTVTTIFALNPGHFYFREHPPWEPVEEGAWVGYLKMMKIQFMTFIAMATIQSRKRINGLLWVIAGSLSFFGVKGGLFTLLTGAAYRIFGPVGSFIEDNNALAIGLIMTLPLLRYLQLSTEHRWARAGIAAAMGLNTVAILGTYSRGGILALAVTAVIFWFKSRKRFVIGLVILVVIPAIMVSMPRKWLARVNTVSEYHSDASALGRINAWRFAYNLAMDRPLVGGGFRVFTPKLFLTYAPDPKDYHDSHSIYMQMLAEQGFPGFLMFLTLGTLAWRMGTRIIRQVRGHQDLQWAGNLAAMLQVSQVGYAVAGLFAGLASFDLPYNLLGILIATQVLVRRELEHRRPDHRSLAPRFAKFETVSVTSS